MSLWREKTNRQSQRGEREASSGDASSSRLGREETKEIRSELTPSVDQSERGILGCQGFLDLQSCVRLRRAKEDDEDQLFPSRTFPLQETDSSKAKGEKENETHLNQPSWKKFSLLALGLLTYPLVTLGPRWRDAERRKREVSVLLRSSPPLVLPPSALSFYSTHTTATPLSTRRSFQAVKRPLTMQTSPLSPVFKAFPSSPRIEISTPCPFPTDPGPCSPSEGRGLEVIWWEAL